jgi:ubiquinone/menaquinone biosynthesis C-methylase UbiE
VHDGARPTLAKLMIGLFRPHNGSMASFNKSGWDSFSRVNASQRWRKPSAAMGRALTQTIVAEARVEPGMQVLDIASGSGEPAISVATLLNGTGHVVATDVSPAPLKVAEQRAGERGLRNIEFRPADVHQLPFPDATFDRVLCRLGVMFFSEPPCAFGEIRRVLKPRGRATLLAWGPMQQPYFETTIGTLLEMLPELTPPQSALAMFKFGKRDTLAALLREAGFASVEEDLWELPWNWPDTPEELWNYFREVTIPFRPLFDAIPIDRRDDVNAQVLQVLRNRYDGHEVKFNATVVLASAIR